MSTLYLDNTNVVELRDLTNSVTGVVDEGATVSVTLLDPKGVEVAGETWPVAMPHTSAGLYRATLSSNIVITPLVYYTAEVTVLGSGSEVAEFNCKIAARTRVCE